MQRTKQHWSHAAVILSAVVICVGTKTDSSQAGTITGDPPTLVSVLESNGIPVEYAPAVEEFEYDPDKGKYKLKGSKEPVDIGGVLWTVEEIEFDPDPTVLANNIWTNITALPQIITFGIAMPTTFPAPNRIAGLIDIDVIDGGTNGASVTSVAGFPIYSAQIEFAQVESLLDAPFSLTVPPGPVGGSNNATDSFGLQLNNVAVTSNIGIQLRFQLSPGDTATVISRFDVIAVPEPTTTALCGLVVAAVLLRRRR